MPKRDNATEPASKQKLKQARKRGEVAYSRELTQSVVVVGCCLGLMILAEPVAGELLGLAKKCFGQPVQDNWILAYDLVLAFLLKLGVPIFLAALLVGVFQAGLKFSWKFDLKRIDPLAGIKRMVSVQRLIDLLVLLLKLLVIAWVGGSVLIPQLRSLLGSGGYEQSIAAVSGVLVRLFFALAACTLLLGFLDRWIQKSRFLKRQRMTRQEVVRENKEQEGDPSLKSERQRRHRQMLSGGGILALKKANVVVVNPTHVAVALTFDPEENDAPVVLASGWRETAARIRVEAERLGLPIVQNIPLARALVKVEPGDEIPEKLYEAVAEVLRALKEFQ
jgi:type III secretion protein U